MTRTLATVRLYGAILWLVVVCLLGAVRETLPDDERTAGAFVSGMAWMLGLVMGMLVLTSWLYLQSVGR